MLSDKDHGLRRRDLKSLSAAYILTHQLVVDANHVIP